MDKNSLDVEIIWLPKPEELRQISSRNIELSFEQKKKRKDSTSEIDIFKVYEQRNKPKDSTSGKEIFKSAIQFGHFLSNFLLVNVRVTDVRPLSGANYQLNDDEAEDEDDNIITIKQKIPHITGHMECLFIVSCCLTLERNSDQHKKNLIHTICSLKYCNENPEFWASMDISFLTGEIILKHFVGCRTVNIHEFGLGNLVGLNTFVQHFDSSSTLPKKSKHKITQIKMQFSYQKLEIYFVVGDSRISVSKRNAKSHHLFKMCYSYSTIHRLLICDIASKEFMLYIHSTESPLLYRAEYKCDESGESRDEFFYGNEQCVELYTSKPFNWFREVELFDDCPPELKYEFSLNTVLCLKLAKSEYVSLGHLLQLFCKNVKPFFTSMRIVEAQNNVQINSITSKDFNCFYALKCILTRSYEFLDQLSVKNELKEVNNFFIAKCKENPKLLAEVLTQIYNQMDQGSLIMFASTIKSLYEKLYKRSKKLEAFQRKSNGKIAYIKRAILTPTHIKFLPAQPQFYNRILKSAPDGHFLRVMIRDIDSSRINFVLGSSGTQALEKFRMQFLNSIFKTQITKGIKLGNRKYEYLGMSSSQMKSHSIWCYAKGTMKVTDVREKIGDLDHIQEVPKFMARMGQSFSQSMASIEVPQNFTNVGKPEKDITGFQKIYMSDDDDDDDNEEKQKRKKCMKGIFQDEDEDELLDPKNDDPYIFSDGIGRMSQEIANEIRKELLLPVVAPAVQIRYAGCKGMLVLDPTLEGRKILFRESMRKYTSTNSSLEILKISKPRIAYLNRSFITILEQKGIDRHVFIKLQKLMIHNLIKSMFYDEDACALLHSGLHMINFIHLLHVGISFTEDPLFRSMILATFKCQMNLLKHKSRIALPDSKARNMFGVLDETMTLKYEEVFIQYTEMNSTATRILTGDVIVTKNPCLQLGDVRKFKAIDVEKLRHIKDCIVFPAQGPRPHPDEMAGSDLDGDEYTVVWLQDLIFDCVNSPAMHYAVPKKINKSSNKPILLSDELNHFFDYILNDTVGKLANAHLARADYEKDGINSKNCKNIAKKHAKAVDFAKTGQKAVMGPNENAGKYPDFMEKDNINRTYMSQKVLGYLYRSCKSLEIGLEATTDMMEFRLDPDLKHDDWKKYQDSAQELYQSYCKKVSYSLKSYGLENEGAFLTGNYIRYSKLVSDNSEFRNLQDLIEQEVVWLFLEFETEFFKQFGGKPKGQNPAYTEEMLMKASAWYRTAYREKLIYGKTRYFGFPWTVCDVLAALKQKRKKNFSLSSSIFVKKASFVEEAIDKTAAIYQPWAHLIDEDVMEFKNEIMDVSRSVLDKWLKSQKLTFIQSQKNGLKEVEKCIDDEFKDVTEKLLSSSDNYILKCYREGSDKRAFSPGHYVVSTLIRISEMGTGHKDPDAYFSTLMQQFGLCAWVTLVQLACSGNIQLLGLFSKDNNDSPFQITEGIVCEFFLMQTNEKFEQAYRLNEDAIKKYCIQTHKVKDIVLFYESNHSFRALVRGTQYNIDRLREFTLANDFINQILSNIK